MSFIYTNVAMWFHDYLSAFPIFLAPVILSLTIVFVIGLICGFYHVKSLIR